MLLPWHDENTRPDARTSPEYLCDSRLDRSWLWNGIASFEQNGDQTAPGLTEFYEGLFGRSPGSHGASNVSKLRVAGHIVDRAIVLQVSLNADVPRKRLI